MNRGTTTRLDRVFSEYLSPGNRVPLFFSPPLAESIDTFAADCTTPKTSFFLGETVCAKTDGVDLGFPGGRWVHWLRQDLSIAHGGSGTTLITANPQFFAFAPDQVGSWKVTIAETGDPSQTPAVFTVSLAPESIATYESTCNLAQDNFTVGATVCAKADPNFSGSRYIYWVDSQGIALQTDVISSTSASATRTMTASGNYWVYFSDSDGSLRSKHAFTVSDPQALVVDLSVFKNRITSTDVVAGGFITFEIVVGNRGPDTASTVELSDAVPSNTTYASSTQDSGPTFTRTSETPTTTWTIASLPAGASASFTFTYMVDSGAAIGTVITNTALVTSTTAETHTADNSGTGSGTVVGGAPAAECNLDCPNDIITTATTHGQGGGANVTFSAAEGFGTCGTITSNPASGSFFAIGTTTVTVTSATGGGGCHFTVTVVDTAAPTITCPANITVTANSGQGEAFVPNPNGSSSNVGSPTTTGDQPLVVTGSREDGEGLTTAYPIGVTDITWLATDPSGRQATCTQRITVLPNQVLTITCPANVTVPSPNGCDPATGVNPGQATSNSQTATITSERSDGQALNDPYPVGTTTIEWTANDTDSQSASCTQTVTVTGTDTTPPTLHVPPNVSATTSSCTATLDDELGVATADEDCGTVNITRTGVPTFTCPTPQNPNQQCESFVFPTGTTIITYTATNSAGLTTTGTQTVMVTESPAVPPTITAPNDVTLFTGPGATSCGVTVSNLDATLGTATANDNCPGVTVARSGVPAGNVFPVGNTTITYIATDKSGNMASDTQVVTVVDNTPPVVTPPGPVTLFTGPGAMSCGVTVTNLDGTLGTGSAADNCPGVGPVTRGGVPAGNFFPVGQTTLSYSATDAHGNTSSANQVVTVVDNTLPTISCPADIIADFDAAVNGAVVTYVAPVGTDNCPSTTTQIAGLPSGSTFPTGTTTNTFRVTDASGNTAECSFKVTVAVTSIIGLDSATLSGNALVDSYDSTIGYPASKGSLANLLSNGTITISGSSKMFGNVRSTRVGVSVLGTSQVNGNATAGTTVTKAPSAVITGTITNNALAPVMTMPSVPTCGPPYSPNSGISGTYSYNPSTGNLSLSGINIATLANGVYCFNNVTLTNSAQLKVNGPVTIKLTGTLSASGATSITNTTAIPANLRILSSFSGSNGVSISNGTTVYFLLYSPRTNVTNSGAAPLFGTIVGKTVTISNSGQLHYDIKLKTVWPDIWTLIFGP
ncbi:MAG: HYR domain-containing protein [Pyrinomonadaceae bacterium]